MQIKMQSLVILLFMSIVLAGTAASAAEMSSTAIPLCFIQNNGQTDEQALFFADAPGYTLYLTGNGQVLSTADAGAAVSITYPGAGIAVVNGEDVLEGKANFFIGNVEEEWVTDVPMYSTVRYDGLYDGVTLVYHGGKGVLKREFIVAPGEDPFVIVMKYSGQDGLSLDASGAILIETAAGTLFETAPICYQVVDGQQVTIPCGYVISDDLVTFSIGLYDKELPLVIDPVLDFSTYLGGNNDDLGEGIALDDLGNMYIVGSTKSTNLPLPNAPIYQEDLNGTWDIFVAKMNPDGSQLMYSTYVGGNSTDLAGGIAVNNFTGEVIFTGHTASADYPDTIGTIKEGDTDAVVTRLNAGGSALLWSRYFAGNKTDQGVAIALDPPGNPVVVGFTNSDAFPGIVFLNGYNGGYDAFIAKFDVNTGLYQWCRYFGFTGNDYGYGVAVEDGSWDVFVTGSTKSLALEGAAGHFRQNNAGKTDAFITEIFWDGTSVLGSTFLGGTEDDVGTAIAIDPSGVYITGYTESPVNPINLFPITPGTYQPTYGGGVNDAFITKMLLNLTALNYSTYLGGNFEDRGYAIAVDNNSNAYVTGFTISSNFPTNHPLQPHRDGLVSDAYLTILNSTGKGLLFSTYLGGTYYDQAKGIAITDDGLNITLTGFTESLNFPLANPYQNYLAGFPPVRYNDAFITKITRIPPVANFTSDKTTGCSPALICFNDTSTNNPTAWYWDFGDGTNSTEQNPCHIYYNNASHIAQNFTVNLTAWNVDGFDSENKTNYTKICPNLFWNLTANQTQGCLINVTDMNNATIMFNGVNVTGGPINSSSWYFDFGDNSVIVPTTYIHTFTDVGLYNITLNVTNECCSNNTTIFGMVDIRTKPDADFFAIPTSGLAPLSVDFFDNSTGRPSNWTWTFGAGEGGSTLQDPNHLYNTKGRYRVNLTACNFCGCNMETKAQFIRVGDPNLTFMAGTTMVLPNGTIIVPTNDTTPLKLYLQVAENGLSGYNLFIRYGDIISGDIDSVQFPSWAFNQTIVGPLPAPNTTIIAVDMLNQVNPGATNVMLASINLTGLVPGNIWFNVTSNALDDDFGNPIGTNSIPAELKIALLQPFPGKVNPPTDPFGDQKYWDVNGNGLIDFNDVVLYFQNTQVTPWVQSGNEYLPFFDYNGNGLIDFNDLILLFQKV